ncbi:hypothetical protein ACHAXR_005823 [Thalassiosira sp. AJA248-18]
MDHPNQTEKCGRGRALMAVTASLFFLVGAASLYVSSDSPLIDTPIIPELSPTDARNNQRRSLSIALPNGGCKLTYANPSPTPIAPTWQASFPGSGARMTWILVEALTGIRTNNDYDSHERGYENVVAVKTHYPVKNAKNNFQNLDPLFGRTILLLRNPINAIPSYFNQEYEHLNHFPTHSIRGPNEDWVKYRDDERGDLSFRLSQYESFVEYWMEKYPERSDLLIVTYEDLTDSHRGPNEATRIANFLAETEGVNPIAPGSIPCVWDTIVDYKKVAPPPDQDPNDGDPVEEKQGLRRKLDLSDPSSLRTGPKERPYTTQNLQEMGAMLERLAEKYSHNEDFVRIMMWYCETVLFTPPLD